MKREMLHENLYMRLNCFIEQDLVGNGLTDVTITCYFLL